MTLCSECANANAGKDGERCCWAGRQIPVKGWIAVKVYSTDTGEFYSYQVIECPNFLEGIYRPVMVNEGCMALLEAVFSQIAKDYPYETKPYREMDKEFIRAFVSDSEGVIDHLEKLAAANQGKKRPKWKKRKNP